MDTGDMILIGGAAFVGYLFLKGHSTTTPVITALTPAEIAAQQAAIAAGTLVPGTTVTQGQLNAAGTGIANIIKAVTGGGTPAPASPVIAPVTTTIPQPIYQPSDPIYTPVVDPIADDPNYTDPLNPYGNIDTTITDPDTSFESDDDGFNGVPVMSVIHAYARNPILMSRTINGRIGCGCDTGAMVGLMCFN